MYITDTDIPEEWRIEIIRYLNSTVNSDGGWGLHSAGHSTVFATTLYYVNLRILGVEASHPLATRARECLHRLGMFLFTHNAIPKRRLTASRRSDGHPSMGKGMVIVAESVRMERSQPYPARALVCIPRIMRFNKEADFSGYRLLPDWVPFHPWRWWIQCRVVYLPVSYLYGEKVQKPVNKLLLNIRDEIYRQKYEEIDFTRYLNHVSPSDLMKPLSLALRTANALLRGWEYFLRPTWISRWAAQRVCALIKREDENTSYNCLAPVNKAFHMVSVWHQEGKDSERMRRHRETISTYMWKEADGLTCSGTNGVQLWDTAFSIQAAVESGLAKEEEFRPALEKALEFLETSQLRDNLDDPYRQPRKGGWPFSTKDNGYIVSDCAAEGLKSTLLLQEQW